MTTAERSGPTTTPPPRAKVSVRDALEDMAIITGRNLRRFLRMPQLLVFATVQPVMFLLLFNFVFGGALAFGFGGASGGDYINFLIPGILVQTVVFGATNTSTGLTEDLNAGVIDRFRSLPMARSAVMGGRTIADLVRSAGVQTLMLVVGIAVGFSAGSWPGLVLGLVIALLFGFSVSWVFAAIGLTVRSPEASQGASFLLVFPFVFASSVFVPTATMPDWLRVFAENQPVSVVVNTVRALSFPDAPVAGGDSIESLLLRSAAWIVGMLLVFGWLAVRQYKKAVS
jgi:ABC-2 type transport system permease protein